MYMTISRASKSGELEVGGRKSEPQRCAIILAGLNLKARIKKAFLTLDSLFVFILQLERRSQLKGDKSLRLLYTRSSQAFRLWQS